MIGPGISEPGGMLVFGETNRFTNYRPDPRDPASERNSVWGIYQDRSGTLWLGTRGGALSRFDEKTKTFVNHTPDWHDPNRLHGGGISAIHEDRAGTLWLGAWDGLYRYNRQNGTFTRYPESQGLPSSVILGILEDKVGRLWLRIRIAPRSTSRFSMSGSRSRSGTAPAPTSRPSCARRSSMRPPTTLTRESRASASRRPPANPRMTSLSAA